MTLTYTTEDPSDQVLLSLMAILGNAGATHLEHSDGIDSQPTLEPPAVASLFSFLDDGVGEYVMRHSPTSMRQRYHDILQQMVSVGCRVERRSTEGSNKRPYVRIYASGPKRTGAVVYLLLIPGLLHMRLPADRASEYEGQVIARGRYQVELSANRTDLDVINAATIEASERAMRVETW